ncbi:trypsin-like peptidase domain-containing protein [Ammonicoccus fulvus]|uniref:Trypsin-like peptidase domain-containing protein n=1 Tax=Ammonicoccus fulvus TaxID=3138240 RepID=A0ABZ3FIA9_9ACTN
MATTCPNCRAPVPDDARACPACGLAHNQPVFESDGTFVGTRFAGPESQSQVMTTLPPSRPTPPTLSGKVVGLVVGIFVLAVVLGVVVAMLVRPGADPQGPDGPVPPGPTPTVEPLPADPSESADPLPEGPFGEVSVRVATGAHRMVATTCTGTGIGTAYQFGTEGLLVTAARAVSGARVITLLSGDRIITAEVAKIDSTAGLAILRPTTPLGGHTFVLGTRQLTSGDRVAALGWTTEAQQPARGKPRTVVGSITEVGVTVESADGKHRVARMTGAYDPGLLGSPVVGEDGHLVGMIVQGPADQAELLVAGLDQIADPLLGPTGQPPMLEACVSSSGPGVVTTVGGTAAPTARTQLGQWFGAVNSGEWDRARGTLAPPLQEEWTKERLAEEYAGTYAFGIVTAAEGASTKATWVQLDSDARTCHRVVATFSLDQGRIVRIQPQGASAC